VFYSANEAHCWDGEVRGNPSSQGTYFFLVTTLDAMGEKAEHRGSFTLWRNESR
jgi:hypothetical protein